MGVVNRITNSDIHHYAVECGVKLYEIADQLREDDVVFFKSLETEMSASRKSEIVQAIQEVKRAHESQRSYTAEA